MHLICHVIWRYPGERAQGGFHVTIGIDFISSHSNIVQLPVESEFHAEPVKALPDFF